MHTWGHLNVRVRDSGYEAKDWGRYDVAMPAMEGFCPLSRVGSGGDGGKIICNLDAIANRCVLATSYPIYDFGIMWRALILQLLLQ